MDLVVVALSFGGYVARGVDDQVDSTVNHARLVARE
jgi:hypothetical protein